MSDKDLSEVTQSNIVLPETKLLQFYNEDFQKGMEKFRHEWSNIYLEIEKIKTIHMAEDRPVGGGKRAFFLKEHLMRNFLNKNFPGWSWKRGSNPLIFGNNRAVLVDGELEIIDVRLFHFLVANGVPPERAYFTRTFYGVSGHAIDMTEAGTPVSIPNNLKAADTEALKYAINRLTGFGNDTYQKEVDFGLTAHERRIASEALMSISELVSEDELEKGWELINSMNSKALGKFLKRIKEKKEQLG